MVHLLLTQRDSDPLRAGTSDCHKNYTGNVRSTYVKDVWILASNGHLMSSYLYSAICDPGVRVQGTLAIYFSR